MMDVQYSCVYIKLIHDKLERDANQLLKSMDVTFVQSRVLAWLWHKGGRATQPEIEEYLGVSHPTVVGILKRLGAKGFIEFQTDLQNRRIKVVCLRKKKASFFRKILSHQQDTEERALHALSPEERETLRHLLKRVYASLSEGETNV